MLQMLVSRPLSRYLGDFVSRVDGQKLQLELWQGDLLLRELELVPRTFTTQGHNQFIVRVQEGHIGQLRIHVPWNQ